MVDHPPIHTVFPSAPELAVTYQIEVVMEIEAEVHFGVGGGGEGKGNERNRKGNILSENTFVLNNSPCIRRDSVAYERACEGIIINLQLA